ncbi:MAG: hypothetical protein L6R36_007722 [Xanthoria steineri]|nr:MAG: hypothetical protein L6R36_007722 [Xanthoria steineri]
MGYNFHTNLLAILLLFCLSALALVVDIPAHIFANAISRTNNHLKGPPVPPGFSLRLLMSSSEPLTPTHVYLCAVEAMYHLSEQEYEGVVHTGHSPIVKGLQVSYYDVPHRPVNMQYRHIIVAILASVDEMDRMGDFNRAVIEMQVNKGLLGIVRIGRRSNDGGHDDHAAMKVKGEDGSGGGGGGSNSTASNSTRLDSPKILVDPDDPSVTISYERFGATLDCKLLFSAALDALATLATNDDFDKLDLFIGVNWSRQVVYQAFSDEGLYKRLLLTTDLIRRVMRLLPQRLFEERACGEVIFVILVDGMRHGSGRFRVPDDQGREEIGSR